MGNEIVGYMTSTVRFLLNITTKCLLLHCFSRLLIQTKL